MAQVQNDLVVELCFLVFRDSMMAGILVAGYDKVHGGQVYTVPIGREIQKYININRSYQCCGSEYGSTDSTCFWASWIRIHYSEVWIRILLSLIKNSKKNLDFYCFVTSF
jgi:hypothetical protein